MEIFDSSPMHSQCSVPWLSSTLSLLTKTRAPWSRRDRMGAHGTARLPLLPQARGAAPRASPSGQPSTSRTCSVCGVCVCVCVCVSCCHVQLFSTPWTMAHQAPPSMGSSIFIFLGRPRYRISQSTGMAVSELLVLRDRILRRVTNSPALLYCPERCHMFALQGSELFLPFAKAFAPETRGGDWGEVRRC